MNWLIISDNESFSNVLESEIKAIEKSSKVHTFDFSVKSLSKSKKYLEELSLCIIYRSTDDAVENIPFVSAFCGYLIGNNVTVLSNIEKLNEFNSLVKGGITSVTSKNDIITFIATKSTI